MTPALSRHVPAAVPGIFFLSGGQTEEMATANLMAINTYTGKVGTRHQNTRVISTHVHPSADSEAVARVLLLRARAAGQLPRGVARPRGERVQGAGGLRGQGQGQRRGSRRHPRQLTEIIIIYLMYLSNCRYTIYTRYLVYNTHIHIHPFLYLIVFNLLILMSVEPSPPEEHSTT